MRGHRELLPTVALAMALGGALVVASPAGATAPVTAATTPSTTIASLPHSSPAVRVAGPTPLQPGTVNVTQSSNWSGYVASGSGFSAVSAEWTVPAVQPTQATESSATWIGVDGWSNSALIQTGTAQNTSSGGTTYYSWYELLPNQAVTIGHVTPGDLMSASVFQNSPGVWTISLDDLSSGQQFLRQFSYSGPGTSAEWVEEAPTLARHIQTLADFGTAQFTNLGVTSSDPGSAGVFPVNMINSAGTTIASTGSISNGSFAVSYGPGQSPPAYPPPLPGPVALPASINPTVPAGYWLTGADGGIFTYGDAQFYGSTGSLVLQRPVVGITPTVDYGGYWMVATDGGTFAFGDAGYYGSLPGLGIAPAGSGGARSLNAPIVAMVPSTDGGGYFMVASDGGVFAFGDAQFEGSCPSIGSCQGAVVAVITDATGGGYWLVTTTGHVYAFGDARYAGAPGPQSIPVTSAAPTPDGGGYWILFANGSIAAYGDATNYGSPLGTAGGLNPATAIVPTADGNGYWVTAADGSIFAYGDAPFLGSMAGQHLNAAIIAASGW